MRGNGLGAGSGTSNFDALLSALSRPLLRPGVNLSDVLAQRSRRPGMLMPPSVYNVLDHPLGYQMGWWFADSSILNKSSRVHCSGL